MTTPRIAAVSSNGLNGTGGEPPAVPSVSKNSASAGLTFHSMPIWWSASTSTSTSLAVISTCGVVESSAIAICSTFETFSGRSVMMSEFVRRSTCTWPRLVRAACSGAVISGAFAKLSFTTRVSSGASSIARARAVSRSTAS